VCIRIAISLAVALVLYRLVECPLRQRLAPLRAPRLAGAWVTAATVVSALSLALLSG
jgi:peptidoglycan/LPS O-acetylase OafA/YrhL